MSKTITGQLQKMTHEADTPIQYFLNLNNQSYSLTSRVGHQVTIRSGKLGTQVLTQVN